MQYAVLWLLPYLGPDYGYARRDEPLPEYGRDEPEIDRSLPCYRDRLILCMAETIRAEGDFAALPILADALEDAGCEDADVLTALREPGQQGRCRRVLDILLGKEESA
jgi:hypothetical protein